METTLDLDRTMEAMDGMPYTLDGVAGHIKTWLSKSGRCWYVGHRPIAAGKRSAAYAKIKRELGDDWSTDFTETPDGVWIEAARLGLIR